MSLNTINQLLRRSWFLFYFFFPFVWWCVDKTKQILLIYVVGGVACGWSVVSFSLCVFLFLSLLKQPHRLVCSLFATNKLSKKQTNKTPLCVSFLILLDVLLPLCIPCVPLGCCHVDRYWTIPFYSGPPTTTTQTSTTATNFESTASTTTQIWCMTDGVQPRATTKKPTNKIPFFVLKKQTKQTRKYTHDGGAVGVLKLRRIPGDSEEGAPNVGPEAAPHPPSTSHDPSSIVEGRSRSAQRWMKLRTTVQLTSAISSTVAQSKKTSLKREDSFIARFSTRQIPEAQVIELNVILIILLMFTLN